MTFSELRGDLVILACAVSAGIHGALVQAHFDEGTGPGLGFVAATLAPAALVVWLTLRPGSRLALFGAAAVLLGLLVSYGLAVTSGVPLLHPDPEPVEGLALATKAFEALGLLAASSLLAGPLHVLLPHPKGTTT